MSSTPQEFEDSSISDPPQKRAKSEALAAAEAFLTAWSDKFNSRDAIPEGALPMISSSLEVVFAVHAAMRSSPSAERLGGHGGYKLGWKNHPLLEPFPATYSPIFRGGFLPSGVEVSIPWYKLFSVEAEYGFLLKDGFDPQESSYSETEIWSRVSHVQLCIELCGTRASHSCQSPYHFLADAMLNAGVLRGQLLETHSINPSDLASKSVSLAVNGTTLSVGSGRENPLDAPLRSLAFLVNDMTCRRKLRVEKDSIVIAGHCCQLRFCDNPAAPSAAPRATIKDGDELTAEFDGLGTVGCILKV